MIRRHLLALEEPWTGRFDRYADLKRRSDLQTVALFLGPLPPGQSAAEGANLNSVSAPTP
jgi:hypothetical protein